MLIGYTVIVLFVALTPSEHLTFAEKSLHSVFWLSGSAYRDCIDEDVVTQSLTISLRGRAVSNSYVGSGRVTVYYSVRAQAQ